MITAYTPARLAAALVGLGLCATLLPAQAQSAGGFIARIGVTRIDPATKSGDLGAPSLAGSKVDVGSSSQPSIGFTYLLGNNLALDIPIAPSFKHEVTGAGAVAGAGKLADVEALPITALLQYRLGTAGSAFDPYVAAGPTYAKFGKEKTTAALTALTGGAPGSPTTMKVDSKLALTLQAGMAVAIDARWSVDVSVAKTLLKTTAKLSTGQSIDLTLNPTTLSLALARRF